MKRNAVIAIALCLILIAIVGGEASSIAGSLSSLPGYEDALAAANGTTKGATLSGSLRSLPGYQEALSQWKGMPGATVYPGTIQRASGAFCYILTYSDANQTFTVYLPANEITYAEGGYPLPNTIPDPVPLDYVGPIDSYHYTLNFRYQGVYYTATWYTSCPYQAPVMTATGTYSAYRVYDGWYYWYWNLHMVATWDASHLPPGVLLQRITWSITGNGGSSQLVYQSIQRIPAEFGFPASELPVVSSETIDDGYTFTGCISPTLCPSDSWLVGPPFTGSLTITTTDGNSYTTTTTLSSAS